MERLGRFVEFLGDILDFFVTAFFEQSRPYISMALDSPWSHPFETLFALFLLATAAVVLGGLASSAYTRSPLPVILWVERYVRFFGHVGAWMITVLIVFMVYEVVARYFFGSPTKWAFEMAYMLMGTSFMFGIAYCMQMRRHIRVDFVYDHVSVRWQSVIDLVGYVLLLPMVVWLTAGLWDYFNEAYRVDETSGESAWNPIIWPFKFSFVIGFVLLLLQTTLQILKSVMVLAGMQTPDPVPLEAVE